VYLYYGDILSNLFLGLTK